MKLKKLSIKEVVRLSQRRDICDSEELGAYCCEKLCKLEIFKDDRCGKCKPGEYWK